VAVGRGVLVAPLVGTGKTTESSKLIAEVSAAFADISFLLLFIINIRAVEKAMAQSKKTIADAKRITSVFLSRKLNFLLFWLDILYAPLM
jgi:putative Mn2+ efflux pump MntP